MKIKFKRITALFAALAIMITALPTVKAQSIQVTDTLSSAITGS